MDQNNLETLRNELINRNQIYVSIEWLQDKTTEQQENLNRDQLNYDYYYNCWLNTNLLELDYSSINIPNQLPDNSVPSSKYKIDATFQIVRVHDACRPVPNDYCENLYMKPKDNIDDDENENQAQNRDQRFVKPKQRQLFFILFNGKKNYRAFEFEPLEHLNFRNCYPGAKLRLKDEILLSSNIMLLKPNNVIPLGGQRLDLIEDQSNNLNSDEQNVPNGFIS